MKMTGLLPGKINYQLKIPIYNIYLLNNQLGFCFFLRMCTLGSDLEVLFCFQQTIWTRPRILDKYHLDMLAGWMYIKLGKNSASAIN